MQYGMAYFRIRSEGIQSVDSVYLARVIDEIYGD